MPLGSRHTGSTQTILSSSSLKVESVNYISLFKGSAVAGLDLCKRSSFRKTETCTSTPTEAFLWGRDRVENRTRGSATRGERLQWRCANLKHWHRLKVGRGPRRMWLLYPLFSPYRRLPRLSVSFSQFLSLQFSSPHTHTHTMSSLPSPPSC